MGVSKKNFNEDNYTMNQDKAGNIQILISNSDHLTRSKAFHHSSVISKKNDYFRLCLEAKTSRELKKYEETGALFEVNKDTGVKLLSQA